LQQVDKHENIGLRKCSFCRVCSQRAISIEQTPGAMLSRPIKIIKSVYVQSEFSSAVMTRQASRSGAENAPLRVADASDCDLKALRSAVPQVVNATARHQLCNSALPENE